MADPGWRPLPARRATASTSDEPQQPDASKAQEIAANVARRSMDNERRGAGCAPRDGARSSSEESRFVEGDDRGWEHLEHTADVQLHGWGPTIEVALEQVAHAFFAVMIRNWSERKRMMHEVDAAGRGRWPTSCTATGSGSDLHAALFSMLGNLIVAFNECYVVGFECHCKMTNDVIAMDILGEEWNPDVHDSGPEVKAVTFASMKTSEEEDGFFHIYTIVDI